MFDEDATFALTGSFVRTKTVPDAVKAADCEVLSTIQTSLFNASEGLKVGDIDADDWLAILEQTRTDLTELSDNPSGLIGQQVPALTQALAGDYATPDTLLANKPFMAASDITTQVCDDNGTPVTIMAEYGG
ncbi:MAG: hypothetical protein ABWY57_01495 [Mycetocola sp.]